MNRAQKLIVLMSSVSDTTAPTCVVTADAATITAAAFTATFTFSEAVVGFDATKITVVNGSAGAVAGTGPYTSVITPTGTGTVTVQVEASKVTDAAGNNNTASNTFSILYVSAVVWFDFSDLTTLFQDSAGTTPVTTDGQIVGKVSDKSGNNRHATQAGLDSLKPLYKTNIQNSRAIVRFDGSNDLLTFSIPTDASITLIICAKKTGATTAANDPLFSWAGDAENQIYSNNGFAGWRWYKTQAGAVQDVIATTLTSAGVLSMVFDSVSSVTPYINGSAGTNFDPNDSYATLNTGTLANSASGAGDMDYCELFLFGSALGAAARSAVEVYLMNKWGITP